MEPVTSKRAEAPPFANRRVPAQGASVSGTTMRVGVDVGGTFTKAVALESRRLELCAQAVVPTTHAADAGVTEGVVEALGVLLAAAWVGAGPDRPRGFLDDPGHERPARRRCGAGRGDGTGCRSGPAPRAKADPRGRDRPRARALAAHRARVHRRHRGPRRRRRRCGAAAAGECGLLRGGGFRGAFAVDSPEYEMSVVERGARLRAPGVCRPRAERRLRARDAHSQRGDQRRDSAGRRAHRDLRQAWPRAGWCASSLARAAR